MLSLHGFRRGQRVRMTAECPTTKGGARRCGTVVGFSRTGGIRVVVDGLKRTSVASYALRFWEPLESPQAAGAVVAPDGKKEE